jgi:hypothetical protein
MAKTSNKHAFGEQKNTNPVFDGKNNWLPTNLVIKLSEQI